MQAICTFMSQQCLRLVELAHPAADGEVDVSQRDGVPVHAQPYVKFVSGSSEAEVTAICCQLKRVLETHIPPRFTDYVTSAILREVDDMHTQLMEYTEVPEMRLAVLRNFVAAILNPRIQTLDLSFKWKHIADYVLCELESVPNLQTLKFTYHKVYDNPDTDSNCTLFRNVLFRNVDHVRTGRCLSRLEHLICEYECSDEMLEGLSETCSQLKTLDINGSFRVTDVSVEYIKKFTHLKILNLKRTKIKREAQRNILSHLCNNNPCPLELYGCTDIDSDHLNTLLQLIPNIQELRSAFVVIGEAVRASAPFHNLKILRIDYCKEYCFLQRLSTFFPHLQELEITGTCVRPTAMFSNWPKLNKIFLRTHDIEINRRFHETYRCLEHLTLVTADFKSNVAILISRCQHLKTLELIADSDFYVFEKSVLIEMPNLEEVSLGALAGRVPPEIVAFLSERCKTTVLLEDAQLASLYEHCPGVTVDTDRWLEITKPALSDVLAHNSSVTSHSKLFSHKKLPKSRDHTPVRYSSKCGNWYEEGDADEYFANFATWE